MKKAFNASQILIVSIFLLFASCTSNSNIDQAPNIILIITDDQGYGDVGINGNSNIFTPHLDSLALESVRFDNFHSATTCAPTRASLMTGINCNTVGVWHTILGRSMLNTDYKILPQYLKELGYTTGIFGKWHLGDNYPYRPQDRGFDEVLIHGGGGVGQTPDYWNNDYFDDTYFHNGTPQKYEGYCTDIWFDEASKFIKESSDNKKPFFAYISTNSPHWPYHIEDKYVEPYKGNDKIPNPNFNGMIGNIDDNVGKLNQFISKLDITENTLLIFMTDNGTAAGVRLDKDSFVTQGFNAQMRGKKGSEYEGGHRVPMFIKFPSKMNIKLDRYDELTSCMDLLPTLVDLLGKNAGTSEGFEGVSLKELITSGIQESLNERIVIADKQRVDRPIKWKNTSVMQSTWRLVNHTELYNTATDPEQRQNIIDQYPEKSAELSQLYDGWWSSNEKAFQQNNYLPVGFSKDENTLLTAHDWITTNLPPWHQGYIREAKIDNGHWNIDVKQKGTYLISLFRWPPSSGLKINEDAEVGDSVSGGDAYKMGIGLSITSAKIQIADQTANKTVIPGTTMEQFEMNLEEGPQELKTWLIEKDGVARGAYYVEVSLIK